MPALLLLGILLAFVLPSISIPPTALRAQQAALGFMWSIAAAFAMLFLSLRAASLVAFQPSLAQLDLNTSGTHPACAHDFYSYCQLWLC